MPLIEWTEKFSIGSPELDAQHKKWVGIYNTAHDRMIHGDGGDLAATGIKALREMKAYGEYHFGQEEAVMEGLHIPGVDRHKQLHRNFSKEIDRMIRDIESGTHILNSEIIKRIENWLVYHILNEDMKLKFALAPEA